MANIKIDGKEYDMEKLSDKAKEQLASLQFVQNEVKRLEALLAVSRTASAAYSNALKSELEE